MKTLTIVLALMLSHSASAAHHENDAVAMNIENAKTFFLLDTDPQVADSLLHEDFEFVFMGRAQSQIRSTQMRHSERYLWNKFLGHWYPMVSRTSRFVTPSETKKMWL